MSPTCPLLPTGPAGPEGPTPPPTDVPASPSSPLEPSPPLGPWIPLDLCRHGDPRRPWDPGAQSDCPQVRGVCGVRGVPAARPLRPCPVRVRVHQRREKSPHVVYPHDVDDFPVPLQNVFFTVSSGNAMTALTLNNLSSAHKVGGGGKGRSRTRVSRRHKHPHSHHDGCHYHGSQHELLYGAHVGEPSLSRVVDHASWIVGIVLLLIMHVGGRRRHVVYSSQDGAHVMNVAHFDVATFAKVSCTHCLFFTYLDLLKFLYAG
ncbi:hypothetical protein [Zoo ranavirus]|uniref:Uncharacterized protein n=1 Tax=Zoo ranavirus TaxID=1419340 RepID=A0A3Q8UGR7_FRG3V|nr:hypothetical protein [Zoo ranavirus]